MGKFTSDDPIGFRGDLNLPRFERSNPVNLVDPLGLDSLMNNGKVRNALCCLLRASGILDDRSERKEHSFVVYQHNTSKTFFKIVYAQGESTEGSTTGNFDVYDGFKFAGYFHSHPSTNSRRSYPSFADKEIHRVLKCPVYTIAIDTISRYEKKKNKQIGFTSKLADWCGSNRKLWEDCCPKNEKWK